MKKELFQITKDLAQDKITEQEVRTLLLGLLGVVGQSEQLKAFAKWYNKHTLAHPIHEKNIENYLKSL